jgi:L-threonylcarbamoyladenylate synthase
MVLEADLRRAAEILRSGGVVAFPTETVYGLGANALNTQAVRRIYELKGRPCTSPLIVHAASLEMARRLVAEWPEEAEALAHRYWPGPLTLVLPKNPAIPDLVTAGLASVGVRVPAHPVALRLIELAGVPVAAPSANRFTQLSPTMAEHVRAAFGEEVLILDGGPTDVGIESTVIAFEANRIRLLRPGMVSIEGIEETIDAGEGPHLSPGQHRRHYSPRTPFLLVASPPAGRGVWLWWSRPAAEGCQAQEQMPADPAAYARTLYATLHRLDQQGWDWIAAEPPPDTPGWQAIHDRLRRAASQ